MGITRKDRVDYKPELQAWRNMLHRCYNVDHRAYQNYGGRGIGVCDEWRDIESGFKAFLNDMAGRQPGDSLDRIDNDAGYGKDNCRWTDRKTQQNNRRPSNWGQLDFGHGHYRRSPFIRFRNRILTLHDWAHELRLKPATIRQRLHAGWSIEQAFAPVSRSDERKRPSHAFLINKKG